MTNNTCSHFADLREVADPASTECDRCGQPVVALTIDTEVHPPKILLIRGRAELDFVDGIPDEYLQATSSYEMTPESHRFSR